MGQLREGAGVCLSCCESTLGTTAKKACLCECGGTWMAGLMAAQQPGEYYLCPAALPSSSQLSFTSSTSDIL